MPIFIKHSFELHAVTYYNYNDSIYPVDRDVSTSVPFPDSVEERNDIVWKEDSVSGNSGRLMTIRQLIVLNNLEIQLKCYRG